MDEKSIEDWCKYFRIEDYIINDEDGTVDSNRYVYISTKNLERIPIKFGVVKGYFSCYNNQLTSLVGSPKEVSGHFLSSNNCLITLDGSPHKVGGAFQCHNNRLINLIGGPKEVGENFLCSDNYLISLEGGPMKIGGDFYCLRNPIYEEFSKYDNYKHYIRSIKLNRFL